MGVVTNHLVGTWPSFVPGVVSQRSFLQVAQPVARRWGGEHNADAAVPIVDATEMVRELEGGALTLVSSCWYRR